MFWSAQLDPSGLAFRPSARLAQLGVPDAGAGERLNPIEQSTWGCCSEARALAAEGRRPLPHRPSRAAEGRRAPGGSPAPTLRGRGRVPLMRLEASPSAAAAEARTSAHRGQSQPEQHCGRPGGRVRRSRPLTAGAAKPFALARRRLTFPGVPCIWRYTRNPLENGLIEGGQV